MPASSGGIDYIEVMNIETGETAAHSHRQASISELSKKTDDRGNTVLSYMLSGMNLPMGKTRYYEIAVIKGDKPALGELMDVTPE